MEIRKDEGSRKEEKKKRKNEEREEKVRKRGHILYAIFPSNATMYIYYILGLL